MGNTALHIASEAGYIAVVKVLVEYGASPLIENKVRRKENYVIPFRGTQRFFKNAKNAHLLICTAHYSLSLSYLSTSIHVISLPLNIPFFFLLYTHFSNFNLPKRTVC